jgi:hypothetical protein
MKKKLSHEQIQHFINYGYLKLENAFPSRLAEASRAILWKDTGCTPDDPTTWTQAVIRLGHYGQEPFRKAANTQLLHAAFNQLVGKGRWIPRQSLGTFPIRFPNKEDPGDTGWHVDASYPGENQDDFLSWRINVYSKGRALLMLFLFSDVSEDDAPTRIIAGSHLHVARTLEPAGDKGMSFLELAEKLNITAGRDEVLATGKAGTVYLCHPFLVHAAQPHKGINPRFLAQPPLLPAIGFQFQRRNRNYSPVETAIRKGLGLSISYT